MLKLSTVLYLLFLMRLCDILIFSFFDVNSSIPYFAVTYVIYLFLARDLTNFDEDK